MSLVPATGGAYRFQISVQLGKYMRADLEGFGTKLTDHDDGRIFVGAIMTDI